MTAVSARPGNERDGVARERHRAGEGEPGDQAVGGRPNVQCEVKCNRGYSSHAETGSSSSTACRASHQRLGSPCGVPSGDSAPSNWVTGSWPCPTPPGTSSTCSGSRPTSPSTRDRHGLARARGFAAGTTTPRSTTMRAAVEDEYRTVLDEAEPATGRDDAPASERRRVIRRLRGQLAAHCPARPFRRPDRHACARRCRSSGSFSGGRTRMRWVTRARHARGQNRVRLAHPRLYRSGCRIRNPYRHRSPAGRRHAFDVAGQPLSHHDGDCTFEVLLRHYGLTDPRSGSSAGSCTRPTSRTSATTRRRRQASTPSSEGWGASSATTRSSRLRRRSTTGSSQRSAPGRPESKERTTTVPWSIASTALLRSAARGDPCGVCSS